jgi:hypothetical protein
MKRPAADGGVLPVSEWARRELGFEADERQRAVLDCRAEQVLLCCARQWGKTTVAALKALHTGLFRPGSRVLVVAPGERQGQIFLEAAEPFLARLGMRARAGRRHRVSIVLPNGSDIVAVPAKAGRIRGFRRISLMIVDEAAQVPDDALAAAAPALMAAKGSLWLMSTPHGQAGQFYEAWAHGGEDWTRFQVKATDCTRYRAEELERFARVFGVSQMRQEYLCEFLPAGGQLIDRALVERAVSETPRPMPEGLGWTAKVPAEVRYFVGVDLGMRRDPTAIAVLRREVRRTGRRNPVDWEEMLETVMTLEEVRKADLLTPYADVGQMLDRLLRDLPGQARKVVVVDATGVGDPVVQMLKAAGLEARLEPVVLTNGEREGHLPHAASVPRRALLENLRRMLEVEMFTMRPGLAGREELTRELTSLGAAGYRGHDDMAFALALAAWGARPKAWVGEVGEVLDIPISPRFTGPPVNLPGRGNWWMDPERRR